MGATKHFPGPLEPIVPSGRVCRTARGGVGPARRVSRLLHHGYLRDPRLGDSEDLDSAAVAFDYFADVWHTSELFRQVAADCHFMMSLELEVEALG
jgi:hypothetical protein